MSERMGRERVMAMVERLVQRGLNVSDVVGLLMACEDGGAPLGDVVRRAGITSPGGTCLADRLVARGLVVREQGRDRRSWRLVATPAGMRVAGELGRMEG